MPVTTPDVEAEEQEQELAESAQADEQPPAANPRDQLLAEQRHKYEASITQALDDLTQTQLALQHARRCPKQCATQLRVWAQKR